MILAYLSHRFSFSSAQLSFCIYFFSLSPPAPCFRAIPIVISFSCTLNVPPARNRISDNDVAAPLQLLLFTYTFRCWTLEAARVCLPDYCYHFCCRNRTCNCVFCLYNIHAHDGWTEFRLERISDHATRFLSRAPPSPVLGSTFISHVRVHVQMPHASCRSSPPPSPIILHPSSSPEHIWSGPQICSGSYGMMAVVWR